MSAPNPDDPLANDVAEQWKVNESKAIETGAPFTFTTHGNKLSIHVHVHGLSVHNTLCVFSGSKYFVDFTNSAISWGMFSRMLYICVVL